MTRRRHPLELPAQPIVTALDKSISMANAAIDQVRRDCATEKGQRAALRCIHEARLELLTAEQAVRHVNEAASG